LGVAVVDGKIYAIGGYSTQNVTGTNEEYNPATDSWTMRAPMPTPRAFFAITVHQNKIYCIGGNNPSIGVNEVYDPATDTWQTKTSMPTPRYEFQAVVLNERIYCIGGTAGGLNLAVNEVYDPAMDKWSTLSSSPIAISLYASATLNGKIYIIGGFFGGNPGPNQIYDPNTDTWSEGTPPPDGSGAGAATSGLIAPSRIYVIGNTGLNQIYSPLNDSWTFGAKFPIENFYKFGVVVVDDKLFVIGGASWTYRFPLSDLIDETVLGVNEEYTPIGYGSIPPLISVNSPENVNYTSRNVSLSFAVNRPVNWTGYSLDGQQNVTVAGNTTISNLSDGLHNVTVYANDTFGNTGFSQTVDFSVAAPSDGARFPVVVVAAVLVAVAVVAGVLVYLKKHKRL
jgi:hypothetical protein